MSKSFKRVLSIFGVTWITAVVTLAFIPHYSCGCGEIAKHDGSLLGHLFYEFLKTIGKIVRSIIAG